MKAVLFGFCCLIVPLTWTANHYKLFPDGKIRAVQNSPYLMKRPGSLTDFIRQVELVQEWNSATQKLDEIMKIIKERERIDDPEIEKRLISSSPYCKEARGVTVELKTFLTSYAVEQTKEYVALAHLDIIDDSFWSLSSLTGPEEDPVCPEVETSASSMDHFEGIRHRKEVHIEPQPDMFGLCEAIWKSIPSQPNGIKPAFRRMLTNLLKAEDRTVRESPVVMLGAVCYWRLEGNAEQAINCARTALQYANDRLSREENSVDYVPYVLFTLGNIMQLAHRESEAALFLELALHRVQHDDIRALSLAALGDAYAAAANLTQAAKCFEKAAKLAEKITFNNVNSNLWSRKAAALRCDLLITQELEKQATNINSMVHDKHGYNDQVALVNKLEAEIAKSTLSDAERAHTDLILDLATYGPNKERRCEGRLAADSKTHFLKCNVRDAERYLLDLHPSRLATLKANRVFNYTTDWKVCDVWSRNRTFERVLANFVGMQIDEPSLKPKYPLDRSILDAVPDRYWRRTDWPNSRDCGELLHDEDLFDKNTIRQFFISPENKGFIVSDLLTKYIGLEYSDEHPLPWNEPDCGSEDYSNMDLMKQVHLDKVEDVRDEELYGDPELKTLFVRLADKRLEFMDVAQRIRTLIEKDIGPKWITFNLAALYYRVVGYPKEVFRCAIRAAVNHPRRADIAFAQIAQMAHKFTGSADTSLHLLNIVENFGEHEFFSGTRPTNDEPLFQYILARYHIMAYHVDKAINYLKEALDKDPSFVDAKMDLLRLVCSGKASKVGVRDMFPSVCCSSVVQNAVCIRLPTGKESCYVLDEPSNSLVYARCNGVYTGDCSRTHAYVQLISPFLSVFSSSSRRDILSFHTDTGAVQSVDTKELPLDYGGPSAFMVPVDKWWERADHTVNFASPVEPVKDEWTELVSYKQPLIPSRPLSFLWIKDKKEMLQYDVRLPEVLPRPLAPQIRKGLQVFPPPKTASTMCGGVAKLSTILETPVPTWVSVTAKGENLEKYIDTHSPVTALAGLLPECPIMDEAPHSPTITFDHLPIGALSDQFLFYKPEKGLTEALKSLGNEHETIDHVAARLHNAMKVSRLIPEMSNNQTEGVHWLLTLVSSLYWRVVGDAPRAVNCLRHSLNNAPPHMRDVALVSLSNVCHQAGLLHSALITAGAALAQSPNLAAIHVTIANIYASIGDYERALQFYYSTLSLQSNFEPAKVRIRAIYCHSGQTFNFRN